MNTLSLSAGDDTESLVSAILADLSDEELDGVEIEREVATTHGLASEPVTILATLAFAAAPVGVRICRLVEQWLENRRQERQIEILVRVHATSPEAAAAVERLAAKNSEISIAREQAQRPVHET